METVRVRYMVNAIEPAVDFYKQYQEEIWKPCEFDTW